MRSQPKRLSSDSPERRDCRVLNTNHEEHRETVVPFESDDSLLRVFTLITLEQSLISSPMAGPRERKKRVKAGEVLLSEEVMLHYTRDHKITYEYIYFRQAIERLPTNQGRGLCMDGTNMNCSMGTTTTPHVVNQGESMITAKVLTPDHRGGTSDFTICTDYEVKLLCRAVENMDGYATASLNNTEQQAGCLVVSDKRRATQAGDHNNKNNISKAAFDTRMQTNNSRVVGGKATNQEKKMKNNKKKNRRTQDRPAMAIRNQEGAKNDATPIPDIFADQQSRS